MTRARLLAFWTLVFTVLTCGPVREGHARAREAALDGTHGAVPAASAPGALPGEAAVDESAYVIGANNLIQIKIFGEAGINQIYRVDESGFITHALVGRIKLGGLTVNQAEREMERKLSGDYLINPQVNVFILEHSHFSVLGEVNKPGAYEITGRVSVIEALSLAGGFTPIANQKNVKILRKSPDQQHEIVIDTTRITNRGDRSADVYIEADDVIVVPKSFF